MNDPNLPAGLPSDFNDEHPIKFKPCPDCAHLSQEYFLGDVLVCETCDGDGEIEITHEEFLAQREAKKENRNQL